MKFASPGIFPSIVVQLHSMLLLRYSTDPRPCYTCLMASEPRTRCRVNSMKNSEERICPAQCWVFRISSIVVCSELACKRKYIYMVMLNVGADWAENPIRNSERRPKVTVFTTTQNHVNTVPITLTLVLILSRVFSSVRTKDR